MEALCIIVSPLSSQPAGSYSSTGMRRAVPRFFDMFSGCGGLTWGFVRQGWRPTFAVDCDPDAVETFNANFPAAAVCADAVDVDFDSTDIDAVIAGVPCQGFVPLARRARSRDDRNGLFRHVLRALAASPEFFVVENVPAFVDWWSGRMLVREARKMGYEIETRILDAADYGVPQHRKRAFILGSMNDGIAWPEPVAEDERLTVRDAIEDLPYEISWTGMDRTSRCTKPTVARMKAVPPGGSRRDLPKSLQLPCWKNHKSGSTDVMGRLRWDTPSVAIRTEFIKPEKGRYIHPEADRPITLREGARLQSFPDGFRFKGCMTSIARQIGNAVPPVLARAIAKPLTS
jgi:DNA (cytosine-5)-methyltransferase 1